MNLSKNEIMNYVQSTDFIDVQIDELVNSEYYTNYKKLGFNEGVLLKSITTKKTDYFRAVLDGLNKETITQYNPVWKYSKVSEEINDFIFYLLKHKDLQSWGLEADGLGGFTDITKEYDSLLAFRKIGCFEINKKSFQKRLLKIAFDGSCYGKWKYNEEKTMIMVNSFTNILFQNTHNYRVINIEEWGYSGIGWFDCFLIIDIDNARLTFFAKDDDD